MATTITQHSPTNYNDNDNDVDDITIYMIASTKFLVLTTAEHYHPQMAGLIGTAATILKQNLASDDEHGRKLGLLAIEQALLYSQDICNAEDFAADAEDYCLGPCSRARMARMAKAMVGIAESSAMAAELYLEHLKRWVEVKAKLRLFWSSEEGEEWSCAVCMDNDEEVDGAVCMDNDEEADDRGSLKAKMPCGHLYHRECLTKWLATSYNCPICRYEL